MCVIKGIGQFLEAQKRVVLKRFIFKVNQATEIDCFHQIEKGSARVET